jgi:vancomycin resistance protein VanK
VHIDTTLIIDLAGRTEADLLAGMSAKRRGRIRRAQRAGVTVRAAREDEIRTDLNAMLEEVFSRQDLPVPYPAATTGLMWERYHADPRVRMTAACYEGEAVAFSISIGDGVRANSWLAAGSDRLRNYNPLALLYWEDILWAARSGYQEYDLVGNPNPGIADYKRQFGAVERAYPVARRENSRIMAWARATYERLQPPPTNEKPDRDDSGGQQDE